MCFLDVGTKPDEGKKGHQIGLGDAWSQAAVEESTRTIVTPDGLKLCLRDKDLNELYNLNDDPLEKALPSRGPQFGSGDCLVSRRDSSLQEATRRQGQDFDLKPASFEI
jgi:hypothetical protein